MAGIRTALIEFLELNYGVLVTTDSTGDFVCQCCGARGRFASYIKHDENKPCHLMDRQ